MLRSLTFGLFLVVGGVTPAAAQSLERAEAAYFRGDYADAMQMMLPLAEQGDRHAQYLIGFMYERGQGVSKDPLKAADWYGRAAERGNAFAQNNLGVLYKHGRGVSQDYVQAYKWFNLAAVSYLPAEFGHRERAILNQQSVAEKMTPDQISAAEKLAEAFRDSQEGLPEYRPPRVR
ncbi:MAG: tetratricopeptide repeat protein [Alphaproteobacteria bacterium]